MNFTIGIIREEKIPQDNRVALTPSQCKWLIKNYKSLNIIVQPSANRCFKDQEYIRAGISVQEDLSGCDFIFGIKETVGYSLIPNKTYLFFSHTKKLQPYNQQLLQTIIKKNITLIDYECLEHEDGTRIIGFGFFAGIVGAHNGIMLYGERTGQFHLDRVYKVKSFQELIHSYFGLKLPNIKVVITGSGRVAHGVVEIMNLLQLHEVEPSDFLSRNFPYPVFTELKGASLYTHKQNGTYNREDFHLHPENYKSLFVPYSKHADILMNGVYWDSKTPRLFEKDAILSSDFKIQTIADITDDENGSVPINLGDQTIENPVYGVNRVSALKTPPFLPDSIDVMAVGNLPNELPRDASRYFGEQLIKFVLPGLLVEHNETIEGATIVKGGTLAEKYKYMAAYAGLIG
jgi:alanine dehydrogenase